MSVKTKSTMAGNCICAYCGEGVPNFETARCLETPPGKGELPAGSGWVICGPDCPSLPAGATVIYRRTGFETNGTKRGKR